MTFIDKLYSDFEKNIFTCANPESFFLPFPVTNVYSQDVKSIFQKKTLIIFKVYNISFCMCKVYSIFIKSA